ncbi:MAG TPA: hypothetical protein VN420_03270 [Candidatus Fimivivens sp.]|nr:hypothetical protein [Candidatus Fimivivens sp.]
MIAMRRAISGMRDLLVRERTRILPLAGMVLVGVLMFEAGFLRGSSIAARPLVVEKPSSECQGGEVAGVTTDTNLPLKPAATSVAASVDAKNCAFVGSRNSTLYHLPSCASAKRIKPENLVCFTSVDDAQSKGYKAGCIK